MSAVLLIAIGVLVAAGGGLALSRRRGKKPKPAGARRVSYRSFQGDRYDLVELCGPTISLLVPVITDECAFILDYCERAHAHYRRETGYEHPRIRIAVVEHTCGAGCGYLGAPGIEIMAPYWQDTLTAAKRARVDQIPLYELGRNYWLYQGFGEMATGFAVFHRMLIARGFDMAAFGATPWSKFDADVTGLIDRYLADPALTFDNTFAAGNGIPDRYGGSDLFASLLLRLYRDFDMTGFWRRLDHDARNPVAAFLAAAPPPARKWLVTVAGWPVE